LTLLTYSFAEFSALLPDLQTQFPGHNQSVKCSNKPVRINIKKFQAYNDVDTEADKQNTIET
jgi:hypothetical protein